MNIKIYENLKQHLSMLVTLTLSGSLVLLSAGCGEVDGGNIENEIQLPTDSIVNFQCADEGIYLEKCVLDNPDNPYANVAIIEAPDPDEPEDDPREKFFLSDAAPSAKARYYLWATALAKGVGAQGENQYYTARSLQELYAESGSPTTQEQAKKAYRSVLDNYFLSSTFFEGEVTVNGVKEIIVYAASVKDLVGEHLVAPVFPLVTLYTAEVPADAKVFALEALGQWGYIYNETTKTISKFE